MSTETAVLAGGCFWCLEAVYLNVRGVESVESGYAGGQVPNPSYEAVCSGGTGHAEVVKIVYDPAVITFRELLEIFFTIHDPTTLNRQGADVGTQYRSAIFFTSPAQQKEAEDVIRTLNDGQVFDRPIVTQVAPLERFYPAEEYHRDYYRRNPDQGYCRVVIDPKVAKLRKRWQDKLRQP